MNDVLEGSITTPSDLETSTGDGEFDRAIAYQTSGTTGEPKRIPYGPRDLLAQAHLGGDALELLGLDASDAILNLCAPDPHISGLLIDLAAAQLGASTYNDSFEDFARVFERGRHDEITVVAGSPFVMRSIAGRLAAEGPSAAERFPNVERIVSVGAKLLPELRGELKRQWGADEIRDAYAATEFGCIAVAEAEGEPLTPMLEYHDFEVLPDGAEPDPESLMDVRDLDEPTVGSLVISSADRDVLPIERYRIGDRARVLPTADGPRLELLGREDDAISFGGALVYEEQIDGALADARGEPVETWRAVVERNDVGEPGVTVYVVGEDRGVERGAFREALFERSTPVAEAADLGLVDHLETATVDAVTAIEGVGDEIDEREAMISRVLFRD